MATDKLGLYNAALELCGERPLANLTEDREPRYVLDNIWARGAIRYCLEQGQWNFAMRTSRLDYSPDLAPEFGYNRAFEKPEDWVAWANVASDEFFRAPLEQYQDEGPYLYCALDTIYVRYVSDDDSYGFNYGAWPESFREFVEAYLASRACRKICTGNTEKIDEICNPKHGVLVLARRNAKNKDLQAEPTRFKSQGFWTRARFGARTGRRGPLGDGGTSGSLIG